MRYARPSATAGPGQGGSRGPLRDPSAGRASRPLGPVGDDPRSAGSARRHRSQETSPRSTRCPTEHRTLESPRWLGPPTPCPSGRSTPTPSGIRGEDRGSPFTMTGLPTTGTRRTGHRPASATPPSALGSPTPGLRRARTQRRTRIRRRRRPVRQPVGERPGIVGPVEAVLEDQAAGNVAGACPTMTACVPEAATSAFPPAQMSGSKGAAARYPRRIGARPPRPTDGRSLGPRPFPDGQDPLAPRHEWPIDQAGFGRIGSLPMSCRDRSRSRRSRSRPAPRRRRRR